MYIIVYYSVFYNMPSIVLPEHQNSKTIYLMKPILTWLYFLKVLKACECIYVCISSNAFMLFFLICTSLLRIGFGRKLELGVWILIVSFLQLNFSYPLSHGVPSLYLEIESLNIHPEEIYFSLWIIASIMYQLINIKLVIS